MKTKQGDQSITLILDSLVRSGESLESGVEKIKQTGPIRSRAESLELGKLLERRHLGEIRLNYPGMNEVFSQTSELDHDIQTWLKISDRLQLTQSILLQGWQSFKRINFLFIVNLIVLTLLVAMLKAYVIPQFQEMLGSFGSDLPAITQTLLSGHWPFLLVVGLFWLLTGLMVFLNYQVGEKIRHLEMLPKAFLMIPGLRAIFKNVNRIIGLTRVSVSQQLGQFKADSIDIPDIQNQTVTLRDSLIIAQEVGVLEDYCQQLMNTFQEEYVAVSSSALRVFVVIGNIALAVVIGFFVIASYAPMFMMGSII